MRRAFLFCSSLPLIVLLPNILFNLLVPDPLVTWNNCWKLEQSLCDNINNSDVKQSPIFFSEQLLEDVKKRLQNRKHITDVFSINDKDNLVSSEYGLSASLRENVFEYWENSFDWRKIESKMNSWNPKEVKIEGLKIHFFHLIADKKARDNHKILLLLHGWPGSVWEFNRALPLMKNTDDKSFSFDIVVPSLVGFGFSEPAQVPGMNFCQHGVIFFKLMEILYKNSSFVCQGGDWGSLICQCMSQIKPEKLTGIHLNMFPLLPPLWSYLALPHWQHNIFPVLFVLPYFFQQSVAPETIGLALRESPMGLASWILEKMIVWADPQSNVKYEDYIANIMIYWLTDSITSSVRIYKESALGVNSKNIFPVVGKAVTVPTGLSAFPVEISHPPMHKWILGSKFKKLIYFNQLQLGGHFAALEQPKMFVNEVINFIRILE